MSTVPPIRREVLVETPTRPPRSTCSPPGWAAGRPLATHSVHGVHGAGCTGAFAGGQLIEQSAGGERVVWGTVTCWEPAEAALAFTWHPGYAAERASHVEVIVHQRLACRPWSR